MREELRIPFNSLPVLLGSRFGWTSHPLTNNRKRNFGSDTLGWFDSVLEMLFLLTFEFRFDIIITELIEKQPIDAYVLEMTETTIERGDAPTLSPSGLWSSEEGLGRLSTHCKTL